MPVRDDLVDPGKCPPKDQAASRLLWQVFIRRRSSATQNAPPGRDDVKWVANTATLVYGSHDAVLVDTFLSAQQTDELAEWVATQGKRLLAIYITHAHPDHFFGLKRLLDRFPQARAIAPIQVVDAMQSALSQESVAAWRRRFPGSIPVDLVSAQPCDGAFDVEGHALVPIDIGHTDTDHTTCLHIPSIDLVISGDAVYNATHPYLVESDGQGLLHWLAALDKIEALNPQAVVCGHGPLDPDHSPRHILETRSYIRDFIRCDGQTQTAMELYERMLAIYPDRINPGSLWGSASAAKARRSSP